MSTRFAHPLTTSSASLTARDNRRLLTSVLLGLCLFLGGCYAQDNDQAIDLGAVSIGDQLIDLKKARDAGVISRQEYREGKADLLEILDRAATFGSDDSDDDSDDDKDEEGDEDQSEEDDDSGFMF